MASEAKPDVARDAKPDVAEAFRPPSSAVKRSRPPRKPNRLPLENYRDHHAYSLTLATAGRKPNFDDTRTVDYCLHILREEAQRCAFDVLAYGFMPDHLHLLVQSRTEGEDLIDFVKRFKQKTGWWFLHGRETGSLKASATSSFAALGLWQKSYYDHVVRSEEGLRAAAEYILGNPVRAGLTREVGDFSFAGSFVWPDLNPRSPAPRVCSGGLEASFAR